MAKEKSKKYSRYESLGASKPKAAKKKSSSEEMLILLKTILEEIRGKDKQDVKQDGAKCMDYGHNNLEGIKKAFPSTALAKLPDVVALEKKLKDLEDRIKVLETKPAYPVPMPIPLPIGPIPYTPTPTWPPAIVCTDRCGVCGIEMPKNGGWGYVCQNSNCPHRTGVWSASDPSLTGFGTATCNCGANQTCQCSNG